jgi:hypothetical protein
MRGKWFLQNVIGVRRRIRRRTCRLEAKRTRSPATRGSRRCASNEDAPHQPELRRLPQELGSDRPRAGELRRRGAGWRTTIGNPIDSVGVMYRRHAVSTAPGTARVPAAYSRCSCERDREAADLCDRPRRRVPRHAAGAVDRAPRPRKNDYRFSSLIMAVSRASLSMNTKSAETHQNAAVQARGQ